MPVVQISVWAGMNEEHKKKWLKASQKCWKNWESPREATTVIVYEVPKSKWASSDKLHSEKFANP